MARLLTSALLLLVPADKYSDQLVIQLYRVMPAFIVSALLLGDDAGIAGPLHGYMLPLTKQVMTHKALRQSEGSIRQSCSHMISS